jgi:hypothetical protein
MWNPARTSINTLPTSSALLFVHQNGTGLLTHRESVNRTRFYTGIILTLRAEMRKLQPGNQHEHPDHRSLRPNTVFMEK